VGLKVASPPALSISDSAVGARLDKVRFLFRLCRLFYFSGLLVEPSLYKYIEKIEKKEKKTCIME